jgi:hypothetical protein
MDGLEVNMAAILARSLEGLFRRQIERNGKSILKSLMISEKLYSLSRQLLG